MFAALLLPKFFLQAALRHQPVEGHIPAGLIDETEKKPVLLQLNDAATAAGVREGMTPSQGLARTMQLVIKSRSAPQEKSAQDILLQAAFSLSPYVEDTAPGLCTVQFSDRRDLVQKVSRAIAQLTDLELRAQAGIGPTPDLSFLAAHLSEGILEINDAQKFLGPLPIETLAIAPEWR